MAEYKITAGERAFIEQFTRKLMVTWAYEQIVETEDGFLSNPVDFSEYPEAFCNYAANRKWINIEKGRVLSGGWTVAVSSVRRGS